MSEKENTQEAQQQDPAYSIIQFKKSGAKRFTELMDFVRKNGTMDQATTAISFVRVLEDGHKAVEDAIARSADAEKQDVEVDAKTE